MHCGRVVFARGSGIFRGGRRLFVCFCKSSSKYSRAGENDLGQYAMRLSSVRPGAHKGVTDGPRGKSIGKGCLPWTYHVRLAKEKPL